MKIAILSHSYLEPENKKNITTLANYARVLTILPCRGPVLIFSDYQFKNNHHDQSLFLPYTPIYFGTQYILLTLDMGLKKFRPDIICVEYNPWSLMFLQVLFCKTFCCRQAKLVCVIKKNTYNFSFNLRNQLKNWLAQFTLKRVDYIIAASTLVMQLFNQKLSVPERQIQVLHHLGVDTSLFKPTSNPQKIINKTVVIGYCGRFDADKGLMDLLEAVSLVQKQVKPPVLLKLLGFGKIASYSNSLTNEIKEYANKVNWLELLPPVPNSEVIYFLQQLDIFVLPSRVLKDHQEHDAHALLEALATGVATIGTRSGIIPEILGEGYGLLVNPAAPVELATALIKLINNPQERNRLGILGRQKAEKEFSLEVIAKRKLTIFKELLNES